MRLIRLLANKLYLFSLILLIFVLSFRTSTVYSQSNTSGPISITLSSGGATKTVNLNQLFGISNISNSSSSYSVIKNTNSSVLSSAVITPEGNLSLTPALNSAGDTIITVKFGNSKNFTVYENIRKSSSETPAYASAIGLQQAQILTSYAFFTYDQITKTYDYSKINEDQLRRVVLNHVHSNAPLVLDIENDYFDNSPAGRDRLARVLDIVNTTRPDAKLLGYYMLLPERSWYNPVNFRRAERDDGLGLDNWWVTNFSKFTSDYNNWLSRNLLYRYVPVSSSIGSGTVASRVKAIYPSLYTFYRDTTLGTDIQVTWNSISNTYQALTCGFSNGDAVRFVGIKGATLPSPFSRWSDYYIINATNNGANFQISNMPGGAPIKPSSQFASDIHLFKNSTGRTMCQDKEVVDWLYYAQDNIAEARKFGLPVIAYISPTFKGMGTTFLEGNFFKMQLEILRDLADGVVIWDQSSDTPEVRQSRPWWIATRDFIASMNSRTIDIIVSVANTQNGTLLGDVNKDGRVNGDDLMFCLMSSNLLCDLNKDNRADSSDIRLLAQIMERVRMLGDIDLDGKITSADYLACSKYVNVVSQSTNILCDIDKSGLINRTDHSSLNAIVGRLLGDVNRDGSSDSSDIIICFVNITGPKATGKKYEECDIDSDGDVDNLDIGTVLSVQASNCPDKYAGCSPTQSLAATAANLKDIKASRAQLNKQPLINRFAKKWKLSNSSKFNRLLQAKQKKILRSAKQASGD